ncbi:Zinc metalloproteinase nas-4 [Pseudolycoriella hygida]|uniref:Metalloendopeptidase n=1 Tax=Pseudolycoriella hygida TaxID=35572 RepID=A0A9Q0MP52_9DIPT|nr:Zinc metalloproteinase nas-4 [Pseudolycoriella hygida]
MFLKFILCVLVGAGTCTRNYFETYFIEPDSSGRNAMNLERYKWPNGIVPYVFERSNTPSDKKAILSAMELIVEKTCIKFVLKDPSQQEHIRFLKSENGECGSNIGYRQNRKEPLDVTFNCLKMRGAIQHELLHVLGLLHEQCRPDRDDFIDILWNNIDSRFHRNFVKGDPVTFTTFGLPYDYESLMHYPGNAFAKSGENVTMVAKKYHTRKLGQSHGPTFYDLEKIRRMYNCV